MPFKYEKNIFKNTRKDPMKFYITNINDISFKLSTIDTEGAEEYLKKRYEKTTLYTTQGIYIVSDNKINQLELYDKETEITTIQNINKMITGIIDKSHERVGNQIYKVPYDYVKVVETISVFSLQKKSLVDLVITETEGVISDVYFILYDDIEHDYIKESIFSLLSKIN